MEIPDPDLKVTNTIEILLQNKDSMKEDVKQILLKIPLKDRSRWKCWNPLREAILRNRQDMIHVMVVDLGLDINYTLVEVDYSWCGLLIALECGHWDLAKYLVTLGADPNLMRTTGRDVQSILTYCIDKLDPRVITFLIHDLGADINGPIVHTSPHAVPFLPLHYAIKQDLNKDHQDWPMASLILDLGGDIHFKTHWNLGQSCITLGTGTFHGSAYQMVSVFQDHDFPPAKKIGKLHVAMLKRKMVPTEESEMTRTASEMISAIVFKSEELLKSALQSGLLTVKHKFKAITYDPIDAPILLLAIHNEDDIMVNHLIQVYQADPLQTITWKGKPSTILMYAIWKAVHNQRVNFLRTLLRMEIMDWQAKGWIPLFDKMMYVSPLDVVIRLDWDGHVIGDIKEEVVRSIGLSRKGMTIKDLVDDMTMNLAAVQAHQKLGMASAEQLKEHIKKAETILITIGTIKSSGEFLSDERITEEVNRSQKMFQRAMSISAELSAIYNHPDYLPDKQIETLEQNIRLFSLSSQDEDTLIDLACVVCQVMPESANDRLAIFSCYQDHLLCSICNSRLTECPVCKQSFRFNPTKRNHLAERLVTQIQAQKSMPKSDAIEAACVIANDSSTDLGQSLHKLTDEVNSKVKSLKEKLKKAKDLKKKKIDLLAAQNGVSLDDAEKELELCGQRVSRAIALNQEVLALKDSPDYKSVEEITYLNRHFETAMKSFKHSNQIKLPMSTNSLKQKLV